MDMKLCRVSGKPLRKCIDFGMQPLGNGFLLPEDFDKEFFFPMSVGFCEDSMMLQLLDQPQAEKMFHNNYAFYSSTSNHMAEHFKRFADSVLGSKYLASQNQFVVEMGCNDGIMLKHFALKGIKHLGIEPSKNVAEVAHKVGVRTTADFFSEKLAEQIVAEDGQADFFLAANVMCHIPNIVDIAKGIKRLLKPTGVAIFEDPYLGEIIAKTSYDQIYDEHVFLFSALSIKNLFEKVEMELIDLEPQSTHGGSMRYTLAHKGAYPAKASVNKIISEELSLGLDSFKTFEKFSEKIKKSRSELIEVLNSLKQKGMRIAGYGATSKSTTILNYAGIDDKLIDYITDTTPIKQGKFTPGMHIPVVKHEEFLRNPPDYAVLFAWNHADEIMEKERDFMNKGGKWIMHIPEIRVF